MSAELANRIAAFTGVDPASLLKPDGVPVALNGEPYTSETWEAWQAMEYSDGEFEHIEKRASDAIIFMLRASRENSSETKKTPAKLRAFVCVLSQWIEEMRAEFGIEETTAALLRNATAQTKTSDVVMGALRAGMRGNAAFAAKDNPAWSDDESATATQLHYRLWNPLCGVITLKQGEEQARGFATSAVVWRRELTVDVAGTRFHIPIENEGRVSAIVGAKAVSAESKPPIRSRKRKWAREKRQRNGNEDAATV